MRNNIQWQWITQPNQKAEVVGMDNKLRALHRIHALDSKVESKRTKMTCK
jgi:hypothetical protein